MSTILVLSLKTSRYGGMDGSHVAASTMDTTSSSSK